MSNRGRGLEYNPATGSYNTDFWTPEQWQNFGKAGGSIEGNKLMLNGQQIDVPQSSGLFGSEGFGMNAGTLKGLGSITDMAAGLGGLFLGAKQLGLAKDKFAYDKQMMDKQYAMAKDSYDRQVARANNIGQQMNAGKV